MKPVFYLFQIFHFINPTSMTIHVSSYIYNKLELLSESATNIAVNQGQGSAKASEKVGRILSSLLKEGEI